MCELMYKISLIYLFKLFRFILAAMVPPGMSDWKVCGRCRKNAGFQLKHDEDLCIAEGI